MTGAGDGNRTNTTGQIKALLPVSQFNWSQMESNGILRYKIGTMEPSMRAKRWIAVLTAIALMFGAACFAGLWMNVIGRVSGWTGLPQYESRIPTLQSNGALWESLAIALLFVAAFVLGLGRPVLSDEAPPAWSTLVVSFLVRLGLSTVGAIGFIFLLGVISKFG